MLHNADRGGGGGGYPVGGVTFSEEKRYKGVMFNIIRVTRGWVGGSNFLKKSVK